MSRKLQVLSSTELRTCNLGLVTFDQHYLCFSGIFLLEFAKIVKGPFFLGRKYSLVLGKNYPTTSFILKSSLDLSLI